MESVLRKRIAPSVPLTLELDEDGGGKRILNFRLSWNFRASAEVEERTGLNLLTGEAWAKLSAENLGIMLWASLLANHPEYGGRLADESFAEYEQAKKERQEEGLDIVLSYIDLGNADKVSDAVWDAYFNSLPKDKREQLEAARKALMEEVKKAGPLVKTPETPSPSDGSISGPLPSTTSDSGMMSSSISVMPNSTLSSTVTSSVSAVTCSVPEQSPLLSPTVLHSQTPIGNL